MIGRFYIGWTHKVTGEREHGTVAIAADNAQAVIDALQHEVANFTYEMVPQDGAGAWKESQRG